MAGNNLENVKYKIINNKIIITKKTSYFGYHAHGLTKTSVSRHVTLWVENHSKLAQKLFNRGADDISDF